MRCMGQGTDKDNKRSIAVPSRIQRIMALIPRNQELVLLIFLVIVLKWSFLEFTVLKNSESFAEAALYMSPEELRLVTVLETLRMTCYSAVFLLMPYTAFLLMPGKRAIKAAVCWDAFLTIVLYGDILHMRHFGSYMSIFKIGLAPQLIYVSGAVMSLVRLSDFFIFADFLLLIPCMRRSEAWRDALGPYISIKKIIVSSAVLSILLASAFFIITKAYSENNDLYNTQNMGLAAGSAVYHGVDVMYYVRDRMEGKAAMTEEEKLDFEAWYENLNSMAESDIKQPYAGIARGKNLIVIQVESLQGFVVGLQLNGIEITPNINKLLEKSIYFPNIYDQTMSGGTSDTEFMINTGLYPTADTTVFSHHSDSAYISLPAKLKSSGYGSYVFHSDRKDFWNRDEMYKALGYDNFFHKDHYAQDEHIGLGLSDESFFRQTLEMIKDLKKPFYATVITLTSHAPFDAPEIIGKTPSELSFLNDSFMHNYLRSINYTDRQIGMFIAGLEEAGLLKDSMLVITGDHAGIPLEYKTELYALLGLTDDPVYDYVTWRTLHKVPLIIRPQDPWHNIQPSPHAGGQIDILPTIAYLMGLKFPLLMGNNLLGSGNGSIILRNDNSYIINNKLILPDKGVAVDMDTGEYMDTSGGEFNAAVKRSLRYNDYIIKKRLLPLLLEKYSKSGINNN